MAYPVPKVEIAFNDGPYVASPTWTDVTYMFSSLQLTVDVTTTGATSVVLLQ